MSDERGMTLVELLVTMTIGMVVLLGVFAVTELVPRAAPAPPPASTPTSGRGR